MATGETDTGQLALPGVYAAPRSKPTNSPFRYPGGKFYARKLILAQLPAHQVYCEPFAGGASIFFAQPFKAEQTILNDLDEELINTYYHIRDRLDDLTSLLEDVRVSKEQHTYYRDSYQPSNDLERAFRWFYLNRTSYSGIMNTNSCYFGWADGMSMPVHKWGERLRRCSDKLQDTRLLCEDFEPVIEKMPDDAFLFVDPPYWTVPKFKLYNHPFHEAEHVRLAECLREHSSRIKFLLTYDDCEPVRELYEWAKSSTPQQWTYRIRRTDDQTAGRQAKDGFKGRHDKGRELFIRNY